VAKRLRIGFAFPAMPEDNRQVGPLIMADSGVPPLVRCSGVLGEPHNDADRPGRDPDGEAYGGIRDVRASSLRDYNDPMRERRNNARGRSVE
jgi:hypothetical protein